MAIKNGRSGVGHGDSHREASNRGNEERLANALGWFSIGLGVAEVVAPSKVARMIGVNDEHKTRAVLRTYGLREIAAGVGILSQPRPAGWLWGRVAGDMLDLASLSSALKSSDNNRRRVVTATAAVVGITALDVICGQRLSEADGRAEGSRVRVRRSIIINRPQEEVYQFWHDFSNLAKFMEHLESVQITGDRRSHWKAKGPGGKTIEWDAEIVDDRPNTLIVWRSLEGADVNNSGSVRFERAPGGRGTLVRVDFEYEPPGGIIGAYIAKLFGKEPGQEVDHDLRSLKQILEVGEVVQSDASIYPGMHPAQPPAEAPTAALRESYSA
jgi:uncharacterized membrane protein